MFPLPQYPLAAFLYWLLVFLIVCGCPRSLFLVLFLCLPSVFEFILTLALISLISPGLLLFFPHSPSLLCFPGCPSCPSLVQTVGSLLSLLCWFPALVFVPSSSPHFAFLINVHQALLFCLLSLAVSSTCSARHLTTPSLLNGARGPISSKCSHLHLPILPPHKCS